MCNCRRRHATLANGLDICPCPCHGPQLLGGTRSGKTRIMLAVFERVRFEREHPNGVVAGEVLERGPVPLAQLPRGDHQQRIVDGPGDD